MKKGWALVIALMLFFSLRSGLSEKEAEIPVAAEEFVLQSDGYTLRAVHTYPDDGAAHPTVLMIAGSGPADADETIGVHTPFKDLAEALAVRGIASLRMDKRTLHHAAEFGLGGIEEEYLTDCRAALDYLFAHPATEKIYLLGHSLGGQMALILQSERSDLAGVILYNSTLRHLAALAYDQYAQADPENAALYRTFADMTMAASADTVCGYYFYGATDAYWASYNAYDFAALAQAMTVPALIFNSTADLQLFPADIEGLQAALYGHENAVLYVDDSSSHYGYAIDFSQPEALYVKAPFPEKTADLMAGFILEKD